MRTPQALLAVLAVVGLTTPAPGGELKSPQWWNPAWKYRKIVRITFPAQGKDLPVNFFEPPKSAKLLEPRSLTGKAVILVESKGSRPNKEIVVTDAAGEVVPSRAYASGWGRKATVLFRAEPETAEYCIYYGNPKAKRARMSWRRSAYPILMLTVEADKADTVRTVADAARAVLRAEREKGKIGTYSVNNRSANPFGLEAGRTYLTLYSGLMYAPTTGTYQFSLDAGGTAHLLIDRSLVLTVQGTARPARAWTHKAPIKLEEGIHNFTILHRETTDAQGIIVGWRRPTDEAISLMSGSAFARSNYATAEVVGFEEHGKPATPFFTVDRGDVAFRVPGGKAMVPVKLNNYTRGTGLTFTWTVGDRTLRGASPRCFVEAGGNRDIVLEAFRDGASMGTYKQTVSLRTVRHVTADAAFELLRCPTVLYEGENPQLTFRLTNRSDYPLPLQYERTAEGARPAVRDVHLLPREKVPIDIPLPAPPRRRAVRPGHVPALARRGETGRDHRPGRPARAASGRAQGQAGAPGRPRRAPHGHPHPHRRQEPAPPLAPAQVGGGRPEGGGPERSPVRGPDGERGRGEEERGLRGAAEGPSVGVRSNVRVHRGRPARAGPLHRRHPSLRRCSRPAYPGPRDPLAREPRHPRRRTPRNLRPDA
jgi:hypothetical protein